MFQVCNGSSTPIPQLHYMDRHLQNHRRFLQTLNILLPVNNVGIVLSSRRIRQDMVYKMPVAPMRMCPVGKPQVAKKALGSTYRVDTQSNLLALLLSKTQVDTKLDRRRDQHNFCLVDISLGQMNLLGSSIPQGIFDTPCCCPVRKSLPDKRRGPIDEGSTFQEGTVDKMKSLNLNKFRCYTQHNWKSLSAKRCQVRRFLEKRWHYVGTVVPRGMAGTMQVPLYCTCRKHTLRSTRQVHSNSIPRHKELERQDQSSFGRLDTACIDQIH
jgi:hypothetical protein